MSTRSKRSSSALDDNTVLSSINKRSKLNRTPVVKEKEVEVEKGEKDSKKTPLKEKGNDKETEKKENINSKTRKSVLIVADQKESAANETSKENVNSKTRKSILQKEKEVSELKDKETNKSRKSILQKDDSKSKPLSPPSNIIAEKLERTNSRKSIKSVTIEEPQTKSSEPAISEPAISEPNRKKIIQKKIIKVKRKKEVVQLPNYAFSDCNIDIPKDKPVDVKLYSLLEQCYTHEMDKLKTFPNYITSHIESTFPLFMQGMAKNHCFYSKNFLTTPSDKTLTGLKNSIEKVKEEIKKWKSFTSNIKKPQGQENKDRNIPKGFLESNKVGLLDTELCDFYTNFSAKADIVRALVTEANKNIDDAQKEYEGPINVIITNEMIPYVEDPKSLIKGLTN